MELKQLRHVVAVAEAGTFAGAAALANITQPALSESIANLERELGVKLFERGRFGAVLTEAGEAFVKRSRVVRSELRIAALEIEALKGGLSGQVVVGVGPFFEPLMIPLTIAKFLKRPGDANVTTVEGTSAELFARLAAGELDFVVSTPLDDMKVDPSLNQRGFFETEDGLYVRDTHPLARVASRGRGVPPEALTAHPWIVSARAEVSRHQILAIFAAARIEKLPRMVKTDSVPIIRHLLLADDYVAVLGSALAPLNIEPGRLVSLPIEGLCLKRHAALTTRRQGELSTLARLFVADLQQICGEIMGLALRENA